MPIYKHPEFVIHTADKIIVEQNKRLWLSLTIDKNGKDSIVVILKNPSKATKGVSDKTVYNVTSYIYKNKIKIKQLKNVGTIIILNLIPFYQTDSNLLVTYKEMVIDKENLETIKNVTSKCKNVIVAWGNHPKGLNNEYETIKGSVLGMLKTNNNSVFFIDKLSKKGNPKHGQVWGYDNDFLTFKI